MIKKEKNDHSAENKAGPPGTVLVIEDDEGLSRLIQRKLRGAGFHTEGALTGAEAIDWIANNPTPLLLLLDYRLPDMTGEQIIETLVERQRSVPFITITGHGGEKVAVEMMKLGARDYLVKDSALLDLLPSVVKQVVGQLAVEKELATTQQALRESEERYRSRLDNLMEGCQIIDSDWRYVYVNEAMARQGRTTKEKLLSHTMMEVYPGIEQTAMFTVLKICMEKRQSADIETKLQSPNGEMGWSELRIQPVKEGIFILSIDITERKRMEELSTNLANSSQIGVYVVQDGKFQFVNPQFQKYTGFSQDEFLGTNPLTLVHPKDRELVKKNAVKLLKGAPSSAYEFRILTKNGGTKWIQETVTSITYKGKRATLGSFMDITERKRIEQRLLRLYGSLLLIRKVNQLIAQADNESELLQKACDELVDSRDYQLAWIGLTTKDSYDVLPVAQAGFEEGYLSSIKVTWDDSKYGQGSTGTAIKTGRPFVMQDIPNDKRFRPWQEEALKRGYTSTVAVPLVVENKVIGALNVYSGQPDAFDNTELDLLTELAGDISVGIEKIRGREKHTKAEKALYQSEEMLRLMFESVSDGFVVTDLNGIITELNQRTLQIHGFDSKDEVLGRSAFELIVPLLKKMALSFPAN
jgi:PAS domain S-box-containing protein